MTLEPNMLTSKSSYIDEMEQIRLARLDGYGKVLGIVHEGTIWNRLRASWVCLIEELWNQDLHFIVVPIRERNSHFSIGLVLVWKIWVGNDKRSSETIWVLSLVVGMIPICAGLISLKYSK